jgi:hypothetical protein
VPTTQLAPARFPPVRRCPLCGSPVPELLSPSGRRRRGRPRTFCSERCRLGDRRARSTPDPYRRREQLEVFAAAVRTAIGVRGLSLRELEALLVADYPQLASSVATLSAWQTGTSSPPRTPNGRDRVLALERCLGVPAGDLALLMPGGPAVPPPRPPARADGLAVRHARLEHLVGSVAGSQQVLPVRLAKDVRLGAGRRLLCVRISLRVRAVHDGVDRYWYVDTGDPRLRPTVVDTTGCTAGRSLTEAAPAPGPALVATELVLDRTLARGEHHDFSLLVQYDPDAVGLRPGEPLFRHQLDRPHERLDLSVSFDPRALPAEIRRCRWTHRDRAEHSRAVTVPGCAAYQLVVTDPVPGGYGWQWRWAPALAARPTAAWTAA